MSTQTLSPPTAPNAGFVSRAVGWILLGTGAIGLIAAAVLLVEKVRMLEDPTHVPACSIDAVLACGSVMTSEQAEAFGFPNPIIGVAGFAGLMALGLAVVGGATLPRWLWLLVQAGVTFAVVFVHWLFFQSVYRIEALCPYCMVVWVVTITAFVYVTLHNLTAGRAGRATAALASYHGVLLTVWLGVLALLLGEAFWDYWRSRF